MSKHFSFSFPNSNSPGHWMKEFTISYRILIQKKSKCCYENISMASNFQEFRFLILFFQDFAPFNRESFYVTGTPTSFSFFILFLFFLTLQPSSISSLVFSSMESCKGILLSLLLGLISTKDLTDD